MTKKRTAPNDDQDAAFILTVYRGLLPAYERAESPSQRAVVARAAREVIQKVWQEPRLPNPRYSHNKPFALPWSDAARDVLFEGDPKGKLVLEHSMPMKKFVPLVFKRAKRADFTPGGMLRFLREHHERYPLTVVTAAEHSRFDETKEGPARYGATRFTSAFGDDRFLTTSSERRKEVGLPDSDSAVIDSRYAGGPMPLATESSLSQEAN